MQLGFICRHMAYFAQDVRAAAERHSRLYISDPFFSLENYKVDSVRYQRRPTQLDHAARSGRSGALNLEIWQQDAQGPSIFHDLYPEGTEHYGLRDVAMFVDNLDEAARLFHSRGFAEVLRASLPPIDAEEVIVDTAAVMAALPSFYRPLGQ